MDIDEYNCLRKFMPDSNKISGSSLQNATARTLVWGYTLDRNSFHVYLDEFGVIHRVIYDHQNIVLSHDEGEFLPESLSPDKRAYPEACDYEFCRLMASLDNGLCFTTFNENREKTRYHGKVISELEWRK